MRQISGWLDISLDNLAFLNIWYPDRFQIHLGGYPTGYWILKYTGYSARYLANWKTCLYRFIGLKIKYICTRYFIV
jgi:hypothetical protein